MPLEATERRHDMTVPGSSGGAHWYRSEGVALHLDEAIGMREVPLP